MSDDDCEDQGMAATNRCTKCRIGFDLNDKPVFPRLEWRGRYWCCPNCSASYGENPHSTADAMSDVLRNGNPDNG